MKKNTENSAPNIKLKSIEEIFVVTFLYNFQGKDELIPKILDKEYGDNFSEEDIKKRTNNYSNNSKHKKLYECIEKIFLYRSQINFYNLRDIKIIFESKKFKDLSKDLRDKYQNEYKDKKEPDVGALKALLEEKYENSKKIIADLQSKIDDLIKEEKTWQEHKYSRNILENDKSLSKIEYIKYLVAIIAYLIRGYCRFITGETQQGKETTWAKLSLNDFAQAFYLTQKLHYSVNKGANVNIEDFEWIWCRSQDGDTESVFYDCFKEKKFDYIIYWLFFIIDVFRGNVYYKLYDYEGALDCYCRALRKHKNIQEFKEIDEGLRRICDPSNPEECKPNPPSETHMNMIKELSCKTIVKVYSEKAKCYFENGQFLESLKWHLRSFMELLLLCLSELPNMKAKNNSITLYCDMAKVIDYLNHEKEQLIFKKSLLRQFFEEGENAENYFKECEKLKSSDIRKEITNEKYDLKNKPPESHPIISPKRFKEVISPEYWHISADILVRIGFLLYTLREHIIPISGYTDKIKELFSDWNKLLEKRNIGYILPFFEPEAIWEGFKTSFGDYCKYIFQQQGKSKEFFLHDFEDNLERLFAVLAFRQFQKKHKPKKGTLEEKEELGISLGRTSMANIDNIVTRPKMLYSYMIRNGYKERVKAFRKEKKAINKLVILRRWQSFNPKIPRPRHKHMPGGGYFIIWEGKGIVIDPGYNFIQNFYGEGFSLADIDAVIITHSHPDHDDELSTILTLLYEWNDNCEKRLSENKKQIDLFLNEGSYRKYSTWLYTPNNSIVGKIYLLQTTIRNTKKEEAEKTEEPKIDFNKINKNITLDLRTLYPLEIEIITAFHDEIIDKHSSIGLKFKLYSSKPERKPIQIGITGDSYAYKGIEEYYKDCDILIAHLGDIKFKEVRTLAGIDIEYKTFKKYFFGNKGEYSSDKLKRLINFSAQLDLVNINEALKEKEVEFLKQAINNKPENKTNNDRIKKLVVKLLGNINAKFKYRNHLGVEGLYRLHEKMCEWRKASKSKKGGIAPLFIIGEFPEELGSYKQVVARTLNNMEHNQSDTSNNISLNKYPKKLVQCLTGDIGLHIGIGIERNEDELRKLKINLPYNPIMIRCHQCNQNNEAVSLNIHYHPANYIQETILKRTDNSMTYLCSSFKHAILPQYKPNAFMSLLLKDINEE